MGKILDEAAINVGKVARSFIKESPKSILITQGELVNYAGSEVITLELAEYFSQHNYHVQIFTNYIGAPLSGEFRTLKNVIVHTDSSKINYKDLDLVWIHHQLIPKELLDFIERREINPKIIFHHMSPYHPLEFPFAPRIEQYLADLVLFNSFETKVMLEAKLSEIDFKGSLLNNPAPDMYHIPAAQQRHRNNLKNLLVVSNHLPDEMKDAINLARSLGLNVKILGGESGGERRRLNPKDLAWADVLVSIGKTVQYAIVNGTPVYCYDHFGGPGYLDETNFSHAADLNFSGRGFKKKRARTILNEIIKKYSAAQLYSQYAYHKYGSEYLLSTKMPALVKSLELAKPRNKQLSRVDRVAFDALSDRLWWVHRDLCEVTASHNQLSKEYVILDDDHNKLISTLEAVFESISWKITKPLREANKNIFRRRGGKG